VATSFVPSLEDVMLDQLFTPAEVSLVHVFPESVEVHIFPPSATAASLVPSLDEVMPRHFIQLPVHCVASFQVTPESVEIQMFSFSTVAAIVVPSLEYVTLLHIFCQKPLLPLMRKFATHEAPESSDNHSAPPEKMEASLVPSPDDAMPAHWPNCTVSTQLAPESTEVQKFELNAWVASLAPSLEDAMPPQDIQLGLGQCATQVAPESAEVQTFPARSTAASLVPSLEDVMSFQGLEPLLGLRSTQVAPESVEVQMFSSDSSLGLHPQQHRGKHRGKTGERNLFIIIIFNTIYDR